jgi:hypothetical protein
VWQRRPGPARSGPRTGAAAVSGSTGSYRSCHALSSSELPARPGLAGLPERSSGSPARSACRPGAGLWCGESLHALTRIIEREIDERARRLGLDPTDGSARSRAISELAHAAAGKRGNAPVPRRSRVRTSDRAHVASLMIRLFGLGEKIETTAQDAELVERVLGLAPNGRRRTIDGTGPWLTGPAEDLFSAAEITAIPNLATAVTDATEAELATARQMVSILFRHLALMVRMIAPARARGRVALVVTSPPYGPSIHGHVRARPGGVAKYNNRYSADPANLAHTGPAGLADGITQILAGCAVLLRPGGIAVITARPWRHQPEPCLQLWHHERVHGTPRYRGVLAGAEELARQLGHEHVGAEQLFLAIIADREAVPTQVLSQFIDPRELTARLRELMSSDAYRKPTAPPDAVWLPAEEFERLSEALLRCLPAEARLGFNVDGDQIWLTVTEPGDARAVLAAARALAS